MNRRSVFRTALKAAAIAGLLNRAARPAAAGPHRSTAQSWQLYEEFMSGGTGGSGGPFQEQFTYNWTRKGGSFVASSTIGGQIQIVGDGTNNPYIYLSYNGSRALVLDPTQTFDFSVRWAQLGAGAGKRRIGLHYDAVFLALTSDLTDGIYFRHDAADTIVLVARIAGVETTLSMTKVTANGQYHTGRFTYNGTLLKAYLDGNLVGTLARSALPTHALTIGGGFDQNTVNAGFLIDTIRLNAGVFAANS